jgi:hypothetical protein
LILCLATTAVVGASALDAHLILARKPAPAADIYSPAEHFMRAIARGDSAEARRWATPSCVAGSSNLCLPPALDEKWRAQAAMFFWGGLGNPHWIRPRLVTYDLTLFNRQTLAVQELSVLIQERESDSLVLNEWDNLVPPGG